MYCLETDELIYINHNGDFNDGCEETIFAYETGAGETELQIAAFDLDGERNHYSAGFYNGVFDSRLATSDDGFLQKRNLKGEPVWAAFMSSENNVLPADDTYDDSFIKLHSSGNHLYALGHFCGNSSSNLGPCYAAVWEGNSEHHTVCSSSSDCEEGYDCKFNEGKCVQQITADTHSGKQNGVLLTFDQTGNLDWYVSFLSVSHAHPLEYNFLSLNYYDSDISLFNTETDSEGYVYVVGTFKSSMKIFTSSNGGVHSEWPRTFCETQSDCNFNDTCSDNCGVDCNGDGSAPENECLLEHNNESIGFLAKISPAGELIWVERFTNIRPLTVAVDTSSSGSLPEVAMGGIEILGTWNMPVLQVFDQESSGLNLSWQLANRVNGDKDQRFVEAAFDDQGGLWVAGRAGYQPPTPQPNYNMTFDSCSHVTQPTENALIFDGNDHVTLPNNQGLGYTPPLTVAGWVKVNNNPNGLQTIWGGGLIT